ncbi:MAG TPA: GyrI-like domain-containing protein [Candidatus Egerieenecus merdigallinarum]|nr:GyrI-like domain-containing protein [Candidatus Egerieenecus merdigallinarum]
MAFDYKKAYKDLYLPPRQPHILDVPPMNFLAVRGTGDPNAEGGAYQAALGLLYGVAFTIKMSKLGSRAIEGYFDYVVPPLEGLWWQEGRTGLDLRHKEALSWISLLRLPEFVTREVFQWAVQEASAKKGADFSPVEFFPYAEGLCVQCLHLGPYDCEGETLQAMDTYAAAQGYVLDIGPARFHHEIYLGDPRRCKPENLKTVLRHPIRKLSEK